MCREARHPDRAQILLKLARQRRQSGGMFWPDSVVEIKLGIGLATTIEFAYPTGRRRLRLVSAGDHPAGRTRGMAEAVDVQYPGLGENVSLRRPPQIRDLGSVDF